MEGGLTLGNGTTIGRIASGDLKGKIVYADNMGNAPGTHYNEIVLGKNKIEPLLDSDKRQIAYIAGASGSGKSYYAAMLARNFKKAFPKRAIYFFSRTPWEDDPAYKKIKPIQVNIADVLGEDPIQSEDIDRNSLVIFDDVGTINDKKLQEAVFHLMNDIMEVGRKMGLWLVITNHLINPTSKTFGRTVLNELQTLTIFPAGAFSQVKYVLKNYFGLGPKDIKRIFDLKSRWVTISKTYPMYVMHEHGVYIIGRDNELLED